MKTILHVEDYFDPEAGYQINELLKISKPDVTQILITSNDMSPFHKKLNIEKDIEFEALYNIKIYRLDVLLKISSRLILKGLGQLIDKINPDMLYLHGIGDFKDLWLFKSKFKFTVVRDCHMSWVASQNKFAKLYLYLYSIIFARIINKSNKYKTVFALGVEEKQYLLKMGISENKISMLPHGYNKLYCFFNAQKRQEIRSLLSVQDSDIVLSYIGKLDSAKSPHLIFDIVSQLKISISSNIILLFIGSSNSNYVKSTFEKALSNFKINNKDIIIKILDSKPFSELHNWFSASDICIWPKQTTLSSIHAQVCNTTVIMEKQISNVERVVNLNNLFEINNLHNATEILERIILNKEYIKLDLDIPERLLDREYSIQIDKLLTYLK